MAPQAFKTDQFGGLDLISDHTEGGASRCVDMLNVERPLGRLKTRNGFDNFTASANTVRHSAVTAYYKSDGTKHLIAGDQNAHALNQVRAYNTSGTVVSTYSSALTLAYGKGVRFGTLTTELLVLPTLGGTQELLTWDGSAFAVIAASPFAKTVSVQTSDNRLVAANYVTSPVTDASRVGFSAPGATTFDHTNDYVQITPGDGEAIRNLVSWRELVFAFKDSRYAVFYGNSTDSTGGAVFNYRTVDSQGGTLGAVCAGRPGVFYLNRRGVYLTTGGEPQLISRAIDPLFTGDVPSEYAGDAINQTNIVSSDMCWMDEKLYVAVPTTASSNDRLLVWDSIQDTWSVWDIPAANVTSFRQGNAEELHFSYATGSNHIGRVSSSFTDDDGVAISWRWRSGWYDLSGSDGEAFTRRSSVRGTGTATVSVFTDYGTSDANAAAVTLGTAPVSDEGFQQAAYRGSVFSHKLSGTGAATVDSVTHWVSHVRGEQERAT